MSAADSPTPTPTSIEAMRSEMVALAAALEAERALHAEAQVRLAEVTRERDKLRAAYDKMRLELELMRRRIFVAKAERIDTAQLELEFAQKLAALDALGAELDAQSDSDTLQYGEPPPAPGGTPEGKRRPKPTGRRDLREADIPEERVEITDPEFEALVARGEAERIGFEESCKLAWQRGGQRRLVVARVKYRVAGDSPETTTLATAPMPPEMLARSLAAPSLLAKIATDKYCDGLPLHRQEQRFAREGVPVDRGTMCRWMEDVGATVGATVVAAARKDALATAFCIATDATGIAVQPLPMENRRQPCRRGHYFVLIADRDHIFFEYTPRETSSAVAEMLRGFSGYVQADAKSVYDVLFSPPEHPPPNDEAADLVERLEVGCWSHARRKFWEATVAKSVVAREGLARIGRLFALERKWADRSASERTRLRAQIARPHVEAFFAWANSEYEHVRHQRGLLRTALGYAVRQQAALSRYLVDGRLVMDNNRSERELRRIAVGRNAWLFVGSDDHAHSAGHLFSLIASARLHSLDPELYLRDLFRVLGHWPKGRYLELAPKYWAATRTRLDPVELAAEIGPLTVPPPKAAAQEQPPPR
jgi:transposase